MDKSFYVYAHYNNDTNEFPFYIGKGKGSRAYNKTQRSELWKEKASNGLLVKILKDNLTENEAYDLEIKLIKQYGRILYENGTLVNIAPGGGLENTSKKDVPQHISDFVKKHMFTVAVHDYMSIGRLL
jgi:hypothetical protein